MVSLRFSTRSSSREYPFLLQSILVGNPPNQQRNGKRALGDLVNKKPRQSVPLVVSFLFGSRVLLARSFRSLPGGAGSHGRRSSSWLPGGARAKTRKPEASRQNAQLSNGFLRIHALCKKNLQPSHAGHFLLDHVPFWSSFCWNGPRHRAGGPFPGKENAQARACFASSSDTKGLEACVAKHTLPRLSKAGGRLVLVAFPGGSMSPVKEPRELYLLKNFQWIHEPWVSNQENSTYAKKDFQPKVGELERP